MLHRNRAKSIFRLLSIFLLAAFVFSSCKKNPDSDSNDTRPDFNTKVTASLVSGFVTDENDAPVLNAAVVVGTKIVATDKYGYFEAGNIEVVKTAATVTVNKTGYFKAIKTFAAEAGKGAFFRIQLIPKTIVGTISAAVGGTVTLPNGLAIKFPAGAITDVTTNKPYTGDVRVSAKLISATDPDLNSIMPGDLRGVNSNNSLRLLTTYGMAAVELSGPAGEFLQISDGKKAILYMPIPASLQASAPASIPLWYFDENSGLWREEGSAAKTGNMYVGEVSHFSFWNCDVPNTYVQFNCTVVNAAGQLVPYVFVRVTALSSGINFSDYGYTDTAGYVNGFVPNNAQLKLEIFDNSNCSGAVYSQVFTTTNVNVSLGNIVIAAAGRIATLTGTVRNCNNAPVTNGFIMISDGTVLNKYPLSNTGTYSVTKLVCSFPAAIDLTGEDVTTGQQSAPLNYIITNAGANTMPDINACGVVAQEYFNYTDNGVSFSYKVLPDTMYMFAVNGPVFTNTIYARTLPLVPTNYVTITFGIQNITVGSTTAVSSFATPQSNSFLLNPGGVVNITEYGSIGQFEAGTFTVTKTDIQTQTLHTYTGNFRVRRTN